jgi:Niemann-Pick C1 protein
VCGFFGVPFGPVHGVLPFLLLGIGIDDMFVIVQSHASLSPADAALGIRERIGRTLQHAGVAITVTSLTDLAAFGVGASTTLPSLR